MVSSLKFFLLLVILVGSLLFSFESVKAYTISSEYWNGFNNSQNLSVMSTITPPWKFEDANVSCASGGCAYQNNGAPANKPPWYPKDYNLSATSGDNFSLEFTGYLTRHEFTNGETIVGMMVNNTNDAYWYMYVFQPVYPSTVRLDYYKISQADFTRTETVLNSTTSCTLAVDNPHFFNLTYNYTPDSLSMIWTVFLNDNPDTNCTLTWDDNGAGHHFYNGSQPVTIFGETIQGTTTGRTNFFDEWHVTEFNYSLAGNSPPSVPDNLTINFTSDLNMTYDNSSDLSVNCSGSTDTESDDLIYELYYCNVSTSPDNQNISSGNLTSDNQTDAGGLGVSWVDVANISSNDGDGSTVTFVSANNSTVLKASNFSFSIPSTATILGVTAVVERVSDTSSNVKDVIVKLLNGTDESVNLANDTFWSTSVQNITYGNSSYTWGFGLSPADVNSVDFGLELMINGSNFEGTPAQHVLNYTVDDVFSVPAGVSELMVQAWAGGGSGGGGGGSNGNGGGGGAGGSYSQANISVSEGEDFTITIGQGGANGGSKTDGNPGTDTVFNDSSVRVRAIGGEEGLAYSTGANGGVGTTTGSVGDFYYSGGNGSYGTSSLSGGGGGGAGSLGIGGNASGITHGSGTALLGGNGGDGTTGNSANGDGGVIYGGAGAGATKNGVPGDGADGYLRITYITMEGANNPVADVDFISLSVYYENYSNVTGTECYLMGNHSETHAYSWDVSSLNGSVFTEFDCRAIDENGSGIWSSWFNVTNLNFSILSKAVAVVDSLPPSWVQHPYNLTIPNSSGVFIQWNATDDYDVDTYFISSGDDENFSLNASGFFTNNTFPLGVANYSLNLTVNDTSNNNVTTEIYVDVYYDDVDPPTWNETPYNITIGNSSGLSVQWNASDYSGLDIYFINDSSTSSSSYSDSNQFFVVYNSSNVFSGWVWNVTGFNSTSMSGADGTSERYLDCLPYATNLSICGMSDNQRRIYILNATSNSSIDVIYKRVFTLNDGTNSKPTTAVGVLNNTNAVSVATLNDSGYYAVVSWFDSNGQLTKEENISITGIADAPYLFSIADIPNSDMFVITGTDTGSTPDEGFLLAYNGSKWVINQSLEGAIPTTNEVVGVDCSANYCVVKWSVDSTVDNQTFLVVNVSDWSVSPTQYPIFGDAVIDGHYSEGYDVVCNVPGTDDFLIGTMSNNGNHNIYAFVVNSTFDIVNVSSSNNFGEFDTDLGGKRFKDCFVDSNTNNTMLVFAGGTSLYWNTFYSVNSSFEYPIMSASMTDTVNTGASTIESLKASSNIDGSSTVLSYRVNDGSTFTGMNWNGTGFNDSAVQISEGFGSANYPVFDSIIFNVGGAGSGYTALFKINKTTGVMTNNTAMTIGNYSINLSVNDSKGNTRSDVIYVDVFDDGGGAVDLSFTISYPSSGCSDGNGRSGAGTQCQYCNFLFDTPDDKLFNCTGQNAGTSFFVFTNTGNVVLDFYWNVNESLDSSLGLSYDFDSNPAGSKVMPDAPSQALIINDLATSGTDNLWLWGNVSSGLFLSYSYGLNSSTVQGG